MQPEAIATIIAAFLSLVGVITVGILQYKSALNAKKSKELEAAKAEAKEAQDKLDRAERQQTYEALNRQINELANVVNSNFTSIQKNIENMGNRLDKMTLQVDHRLDIQDTRLKAVTDELRRNAREYSTMLSMHKQTESRMQTVMEIESYNLKFSKETASSLQMFGQMVIQAMGDTVHDVGDMQSVLNKNKATQEELIDTIIATQMQFFRQGELKPDATLEKDIARINNIDAPVVSSEDA